MPCTKLRAAINGGVNTGNLWTYNVIIKGKKKL